MSKLRDRIVKHGFVAIELLRAWLSRTPRHRILFSEVKRARAAIERSFRFAPYEIQFGEFSPETVASYDVLVPLLLVGPVRRLDELRALAGRNRMPIPSRSAIDACDDKLLFHERMAASGLSEFLPRIGDSLTPPYVLKGRSGDSGRNVHLVHDDSDARDLPADAKSGDYFRQELIPGRHEYTAHILFIDGRIRRSLCIEHDMAQEISVNGRSRPSRQRIVRCRHLAVFARMLAALEFEGICNIDFKLRDGRPVVMEINPRVGTSLSPYFFAFVRSLPRTPRTR